MPRSYKPEKLIWNYTPVLKPMPAPVVSSVDESPFICVKITEKLIPYLIGLLEMYRWQDKLSGTPSDVLNGLGIFQDLIVAFTEGNTACDSSPLEDTLANSIFDLTDGLLQTTQSGGVVTPAGYLIDDSANIAITTESRIISVTVLGKDTGGVMSIYQNGLLQEYPVPVGVGEKIEIIFDTLTTSAKVMLFVFESL